MYKSEIFGVPISICQMEQGIELIEGLIYKKSPQMAVFANVHTLNLCYEIPKYVEVLKQAALVLRDGTGVAWALRRKGIFPQHNFVGTDFIPRFVKKTAKRPYKMFLLGSRPGIAERAANKLNSFVAERIVVGTHHGYFSKETTDEVIYMINKAKPDILLVAMGNPKQELWIAENLYRLKVPLSIGVGALFDYLSGHVVRAPQWMLRMGVEWIFRLIIEPRRLWKRYMLGNMKFIIRILRED